MSHYTEFSDMLFKLFPDQSHRILFLVLLVIGVMSIAKSIGNLRLFTIVHTHTDSSTDSSSSTHNDHCEYYGDECEDEEEGE